jgi:hypothetical protein
VHVLWVCGVRVCNFVDMGLRGDIPWGISFFSVNFTQNDFSFKKTPNFQNHKTEKKLKIIILIVIYIYNYNSLVVLCVTL